jgi:hypothetical protein
MLAGAPSPARPRSHAWLPVVRRAPLRACRMQRLTALTQACIRAWGGKWPLFALQRLNARTIEKHRHAFHCVLGPATFQGPARTRRVQSAAVALCGCAVSEKQRQPWQPTPLASLHKTRQQHSQRRNHAAAAEMDTHARTCTSGAALMVPRREKARPCLTLRCCPLVEHAAPRTLPPHTTTAMPSTNQAGKTDARCAAQHP